MSILVISEVARTKTDERDILAKQQQRQLPKAPNALLRDHESLEMLRTKGLYNRPLLL